MKASGFFRRAAIMGLGVVLSLLLVPVSPGGDTTREQHDAQAPNPGCPSPVLPEVALFLGEYANLELTITANRDGSLQKVIVSKRSQARIYDEYTRKWVATHWRMPTAKPSEPDARRFIAPIVYPKTQLPPGAHCPTPDYPLPYRREHLEGLVILEITVAPSGEVESTRTLLSSGHKVLDGHTEQWVKRRWKFPPGEKRWFEWPVAYVLN